ASRSRCWPRRASQRRASARRGCILCTLRRAVPSSMARSHASSTLSPRKAALPPLLRGIAWPMHWPRQARTRSWSWAAPAAAGSGTHDATVHTLAPIGELLGHGSALLPGETTAFGIVGTRPVLALPGRLDAALAAWHMLGRVMLARLAGSRDAPPMRTAKLTHKVSSPV